MKSRIWLALLALYIAWGSTYLAIRLAVETIPPFFMAGTRFLVAGLIVYTWRRLAGDPKPTPAQWRNAAIVGVFLLVGGNGGITWAEQHVPSGITALIVAAMPLWVALLDALRPGGKRPTWQTAAGVLMGLAGIIILVGPAEFNGGQAGANLIGISAILLAALSWAIGSIYGRGADLPKSALQSAGMEMLTASAELFLVGLVTGETSRLNLAAISLSSLAGLVYLIVVGSLIGYVAYAWLLKSAPTSLVVTYAYVNPLVAVLLGSLLASEVLSARVFIAAPLIIAAVALTQWKRAQAQPLPPVRMVIQPAHGED